MKERDAVRIGLLGLVAVALAIGLVAWLLVPGANQKAAPPGIESPSPLPRLVTPAPDTRAITPRAFADTEPAEDAKADGALVIEVIGPAGAPAPRSRLLLFQRGQLLATSFANDAGIAVMRPGEGQGDLTVIPEDAPIHKTTIALDPGRRRIELPGGVAITGRVEIVGVTPREAVSLWAYLVGSAVLPVSAYDALENEVSPRVTTSPSGQFELLGLAKDSRWGLTNASPGYRLDEVLVDGNPVALVTAPASGVVIRFTRFPLVRGRVVTGDPPAPVPKANCGVTATTSTTPIPQSYRAGPDGKFAFGIADMHGLGRQILRIEVKALGPRNLGSKTVTLDPAPTDDVDLGDIVVPTARTLNYVVRDAAGVPIEGALARSDWVVDQSTRTDARGRGSIRIAPETTRIFVGKLEYEVAEVQVPPESAPEPLPIVLGRSTGLEIRITASAGLLHPSVRARVWTEHEKLFTTEQTFEGNDPIVIALGGSKSETGTHDSQGSIYWFPPARDGRYVIAGLQPAVPITVDAIDASRLALARNVVTLAPGEWKTIDLTVTKTARSLRGRVRDAEGKPLAEAFAAIDSRFSVGSRGSSRLEWNRIGARTGSDGRFLIEGIFDDPVWFDVGKEGYATILERSLTLPPEGVDLELQMLPISPPAAGKKQ